MSDTIFALSSGQGVAGVAVVRMSGPAVQDAFRALCGTVPPARSASLMAIRDARGIIDEGLCLYFPGPRSFSGEDMGEFQIHGGRAVTAALLSALGRVPGLRPADRGEFTRRAFVNGKVDLVEAEALGDLIAAETRDQLVLARRLASGELSVRAERWRGVLVSAMAMLEASIDFADEGDVSESAADNVDQQMALVLAEIEAACAGGGRGERLRQGVMVVVAGPPNAGKSTLINALARRDVAIVSPEAGTTRDAIEVHLDLDGLPVTLIDTAGLHDAAQGVEAMGIERARRYMEQADLVIWLEPADSANHSLAPPLGALVLRTKADLAFKAPSGGSLSISAVTGYGIDALLGRLVEKARELAGAEGVLVARERQRFMLAACAAELRGLVDAGHAEPAEIRAERLRMAVRALGRLTGRVDVEEVLSEIFAGFCIGK